MLTYLRSYVFPCRDFKNHKVNVFRGCTKLIRKAIYEPSNVLIFINIRYVLGLDLLVPSSEYQGSTVLFGHFLNIRHILHVGK